MPESTAPPFTVRPLHPLGAELSNVDISNLLHTTHLPSLLHTYGFLLFPGHKTSPPPAPSIHAPNSLEHLASLFATPEDNHPVNVFLPDTRTQRLATMGDSGIPADSFMMHSDRTWTVSPSAATVLAAHELPDGCGGGSTQFTDSCVMLERVPGMLKERLMQCDVVHDIDFAYEQCGREVHFGKKKVPGVHIASHPAIVMHPDTGRPALFASFNTVNRLVPVCGELSEGEAEKLLKDVLDAAYDSMEVYVHHWKKHDVIVWDNFSTQHAATNDYVGKRVMFRVTAADLRARPERWVGGEEQVVEAARLFDGDAGGWGEVAYRYERDMARHGYAEARFVADEVARLCESVEHLETDGDGVEAKVLDVGCGTGLVAMELLRQHGLAWISGSEDIKKTVLDGCDISGAMLCEARRRLLYRRVFERAVEGLGMITDVYDIVCCAGLVGRGKVADDAVVLEEMGRLVAEGGHVVFSAPRKVVSETVGWLGKGECIEFEEVCRTEFCSVGVDTIAVVLRRK